MATRYSWRSGARISIDAAKAGRELERLRQENSGDLTPETVLERARSANSALHSHFVWDDTEAAHQYRLSQAGELIRSIVIDVSKSNLSTQTVRAFVNVERDGKRTYTSTVHAMSDEALRQQILSRAWEELEAFRRKYASLKELSRVFEAMDKARQKVEA